MKKRLLILPFIAMLSAPAMAGSSQPGKIVELFTSQGCSSCPPANSLVNEISGYADVLALTYSVTYWDYLGWTDTFGKREFTERQKAYGEAFDEMNIYTPQIILNGSEHSPRYKTSDLQDLSQDSAMPGLTLLERDGRLCVEGAFEAEAEYNLHLVEYVPGPQSVKVNRGENRGRVLTLSNVVTNVTKLGPWDMRDLEFDTDIIPQKGTAYALLLHDVDSHQIHAAVKYTKD